MDPYIRAEKAELLFSGQSYFNALDRIIRGANEVLHIHMYILDDDKAGQVVVQQLEAAVQRGVDVFLLLDAFGSKSLSPAFFARLRAGGIRVRKFSPLFSKESIRMGRRLHHKIVVADRSVALVGGINIADKYKGVEGEAAWLDYAVRLEGEACGYLHQLCERIFFKKSFYRIKKFPVPRLQEGVRVRFRRNDWILGKNEIYRGYVDAITHSQKSVRIVASYFMPGEILRKALRKAAKRGVQVEIILTAQSDLPFLMHAEKYLYDFLARNNIVIYEWCDSVLHGKAISVDGHWVSVGSYNLNYVSRYRSIELNTDVLDEGFARVFDEHFDDLKQNRCRRITPANLKHGLYYRFQNWLAYNYYKYMMRILLPLKK